MSRIIDVLRNQERIDFTEPEDVWLTERLGHRPGANLANGTVSLTFSGRAHTGPVEKVTAEEGNVTDPTDPTKAGGELVKGIDDWRDGFYEPMGYHTGASGTTLPSLIWGNPENRKHIWNYCPEVKMMLKMDAARYVPGDCKNTWKRSEEEGWDSMYGDMYGGVVGETEIIDGVEYPLLPEGLMPW